VYILHSYGTGETGMDKTKGVPKEFHTLTPYLIFSDAASAIEFYKKAFGATELFRWEVKERILHAEIQIGSSPIMLTDENPEYAFNRSVQSMSGSPVHLFLYVEDVDDVFQQALAAGAKELMPLKDVPDEAERRGGLVDPFGYIWWVATQIEDISRAELQKRFDTQE
jgi:PhnB protein